MRGSGTEAPPRGALAAALAGIAAALGAGTCCLAPALSLLFGVSAGSLGALAALEPYRPVFLAGGALALGYAAWRLREPAAGACADACATPAARARRRRLRRLLGAGIALYLLAALYPVALAHLL